MAGGSTDGTIVSTNDTRGDFKAQVMAATDIVALIGRSVALKQRGRDYVGLCPFHQEKSPSFTVSPSKQFFYCYGCKAGGDAISFVMKRDRVEFIEALKLLGQDAGLEMPKFGLSKEKTSEKQVLLEANSAACAFFEKLLSHPEQGAAARAYLAQRGFTAETIQRFQLGYAAESWDAFLKSQAARKFRPEQLFAAGLAKKREKGDGYYDAFRNRLMFPIRDENARVIAFGGRVMPGSPDPAKYLNSPETPLFSKSRTVFGLDLARQKIVESRTVVVVEGYTDVAMAHQFGASNVVSILGTALTDQHVQMLRRFADRIVLLFDADTAGETAVDRAVGLFLTQPIEIAIASMPPDVDPDEYLLKEGLEGFEKLIAAAPDALTYKWKQLDRQFNADGTDLTGQQKAVEQYLDTLAAARGSGPVDAIRWGSALARVSRLTDIPVDQLNRRFKAPRRNEATRFARPAPAPAPEAPDPAAAQLPRQTGPRTARQRAERRILGILLLEPQRWVSVQKSVSVGDFTDPWHRQLAEVYWEHQRDEGEPVFNEFLGYLGQQGKVALQELAVTALDEVESLPDPAAVLAEATAYLDEERQLQEKQKLIATLRRTSEEPLSEQDEVAALRGLQEQARHGDLRRS